MRTQAISPFKKYEKVVVPTVQRVSQTRLAELLFGAAHGMIALNTPVMELTARRPYDATHGLVDVYQPGRWDCTSDLIFMDSIVTGATPGEWEGSAAYVQFKAPAKSTYLVAGHFTGYECTMWMHGPWGSNSAYTAVTTDTGAVVALWDAHAGDALSFTMNCTSPENLPSIGYIKSIEIYKL